MVEKLQWHHFTSDPEKRKIWIKLVGKGRKDFLPGNWNYACSNHFLDAKPTSANPNPTLFLTVSDQLQSSPKKRKIVERSPYVRTPVQKESNTKTNTKLDGSCNNHNNLFSSRIFENITREHVRFYTGFLNSRTFKCIFDYVKFKASTMRYWDGKKKMTGESSYSTRLSDLFTSPDIDTSLLNYEASKPGPARKLSLEQEFF